MKLFGIPIKIEPSFFVIVAFLAIGRAASPVLLAEWILVVIVSILLHEFGHAFAARAFGLNPQIRLYQMGGQTFWLDGTELSPPRHLLISLAGPLAGFVFGGLVFFLAPIVLGSDPSDLARVTYFDLLWVNIGWGLFNLLPMLPLDGGGIMASLEAWVLRRKDRLVSHALSALVALAITWWAFTHRWVWIAFLGIWFAYTNLSSLFQKFQAHSDRTLETSLDQIRDALSKNEFSLALDRIAQVQRRARSQEMKRNAAYLLVVTYIKQEEFARAEEELGRFTALFGENLYLQGALRFFRGDTAGALPYLQSLFEQSPDQRVGLMIFKCLIAQQSFAGALDFSRHPVFADVKWEMLVELQSAAFDHDAFEMSIQAGKLASEQKDHPQVAYNVACALSRKGETMEGVAWLRRAIELGFNDKAALQSDPDLEALRTHPEFGALLEKL